jgi:quercetin dioxygenase-like cupin family protein/Zn ribbon nucleic-acid-binding protein
LNWKNKKKPSDLEYLKQGEKEFIDKRGKISNYELTEPINLIGLITSKKNTVRANHYHPVQEQKCLVTEGRFISVFKNLLEPNQEIITHVVNKGDITITKPNVAHAMVFSEDTTFLNLVRGEREHDNYGITHTIAHVLVNDKLKKDLLAGYKFDCRVCGNIICNSCSSNDAYVFFEWSKKSVNVRACVQCYWGQEIMIKEDIKVQNKKNEFAIFSTKNENK